MLYFPASTCAFFSLCGFVLVRFFPCALFTLCAFFRVRFFPMRLYTYALFSGALFSGHPAAATYCYCGYFRRERNYYIFHGRVTLFFANNSLTQCRITMEFLHNFFLNHEVIFSSHAMVINTSTKEFTLVNNAIPSQGIAIEYFLYYKMVANVY